MKKRRKTRRKLLFVLLLSVVLFSMLAVSASAEDGSAALEELERRFEELVGGEVPTGFDEPEKLTRAIGFEAILSDLFSSLAGERGEILSFFLLAIGAAFLFSAAERISFPDAGIGRVTAAGVSAVLSLPLAGKLVSLVGAVSESLSAATSFCSELLPILTAITAAGGGTASASVEGAGMALSLSAVGLLSEKVLLPLSSFLFALSLVSMLSGAVSFSALAGAVRGAFLWVLGILSALFLATLGLQTVIAGAADGAAMRAAKYAAGSLPMVGATVSGALGTLASGVSYLRAAVGTSSVLLLLSIVSAPLVLLLLYRLALSAGGLLLSFFGAPAGERVFAAFRAALDAVIGVYAVSALLFLFEIVLFMKCGVGV